VAKPNRKSGADRDHRKRSRRPKRRSEAFLARADTLLEWPMATRSST